MLDALDRPLRDLRISVTDRCNLRCRYCMPREVYGADYRFLPRAEILDFEEIARLARVFARLGVRKIRLTGGEPLLRRDIERLVAMLARIDGIDEIAMTTNGLLLAGRAQALARAGLARVTVSLDALDDGVLRAIGDAPLSARRVLAGVDAAGAAGLHPVKVNMVVRRGVNDHCVVDMAERFRHSWRGAALHRIHGRGRQQRLAPGGGRAGAGDPALAAGALAAGAARPRRRGRGGLALSLLRRRWGDRADPFGQRAVLRRMHTRAAVGRRQAVYLPVRAPRT